MKKIVFTLFVIVLIAISLTVSYVLSYSYPEQEAVKLETKLLGWNVTVDSLMRDELSIKKYLEVLRGSNYRGRGIIIQYTVTNKSKRDLVLFGKHTIGSASPSVFGGGFGVGLVFSRVKITPYAPKYISFSRQPYIIGHKVQAGESRSEIVVIPYPLKETWGGRVFRPFVIQFCAGLTDETAPDRNFQDIQDADAPDGSYWFLTHGSHPPIELCELVTPWG